MPSVDSPRPPPPDGDPFATMSGDDRALCPDIRDPELDALEAWRQGDRAAGDALVGRHATDLLRFFRRMGMDGERDRVVSTFRTAGLDPRKARTALTLRELLFRAACEHLAQPDATTVGGLPFEPWLLLVLRHQHGFHVQEIARMLESTPTAIEARLASAEQAFEERPNDLTLPAGRRNGSERRSR